MRHLLLALPVLTFFVSCSNREVRVEAKERTITVTGAADTELSPDEVTLTIQVGEYYKEQYEEGKKEKDYKTLVKLDEIEKPILALLKKNGVADSSIHFSYVNTEWRWYSYEEKKPVHFEKTMLVKFTDFNKAVAIIQQLDTKGINHLSLGNFRSSKEQQMRRELKAEALKAAMEKAEYMLSKVDKHIGEIVSIRELGDNETFWMWDRPAQSSISNASYDEYSSPSASVGPQDIKMRYEVEAEFEID
jgi:uncharacterized protein